jgi:integrase
MSRGKTFNDDTIAKLRLKDGQLVRDPLSPGHLFIRINRASKSFTVVACGPDGVQKWATIGRTDHVTIDEARIQAKAIVKRIKAGETPKEPPKPKAQTVEGVVADWFEHYVIPNKLRSEKEIRRRLNTFMLPRLGKRDFADIKRSDLTPLFDHVVKVSGARSADQLLGDFRGLALFFAGRNDNYASPLIRGMKRGTNTLRERVLNHDEIRMLWKAASDGSRFGAVVKLLLLTAARRDKVIGMKWDAIDEAGIWTVPRGPREKPTAGTLPLPELALNIIGEQPRISTSPYVFPAYRGTSHLAAAGVLKRGLDKRLAEMGWADIPREQGVEAGWTLHDLRRSARTLLSELKIDREDSERVLGHKIGSSIEQTYDRHRYDDEKRRALNALAFYIERIIVDPYIPPTAPAVDDGKVVELAARRA